MDLNLSNLTQKKTSSSYQNIHNKRHIFPLHHRLENQTPTERERDLTELQRPLYSEMNSFYLHSSNSIWSDAAGTAGNIFAFGLFVSPIPTFCRIARNQSTEQFSGLPYIYSLLNCLICVWYGMPFVMPGIILVATVNSIGAIFQLIYVTLFIIYTEKAKKVKMIGLLLAALGIFAVIAVVSMKCLDPHTRQLFVGYLSVFTLISMFASPMFVINLVIQTKSVEFMPFYLSLSTFLMSASFFAYGMLKYDPFVYVPNGIGTMLGAVQLLLYAYFCKRHKEESREPLVAW